MKPNPISALIITGSELHDWVNTTPAVVKCLESTGRFKVTVSDSPARDLTPDYLSQFGVAILYYRENPKPSRWDILDQNGMKTGKVREIAAQPDRWPEAAEEALVNAVSAGMGCVALHYATSAFDEGEASWPEYENLVGGGWRVSKKCFGHSKKLFQFDVVTATKDHPITRDFPSKFRHSKDELYHRALMLEGNTVLNTAFDDPTLGDERCTGKQENLTWVRHYGKGRVFTTLLGHGPQQIRLSPGFQALFCRGCEWAATGEVTLPLPEKMDAEVAI